MEETKCFYGKVYGEEDTKQKIENLFLNEFDVMPGLDTGDYGFAVFLSEEENQWVLRFCDEVEFPNIEGVYMRDDLSVIRDMVSGTIPPNKPKTEILHTNSPEITADELSKQLDESERINSVIRREISELLESIRDAFDLEETLNTKSALEYIKSYDDLRKDSERKEQRIVNELTKIKSENEELKKALEAEQIVRQKLVNEIIQRIIRS